MNINGPALKKSIINYILYIVRESLSTGIIGLIKSKMAAAKIVTWLIREE
jgi:hypothetical protein